MMVGIGYGFRELDAFMCSEEVKKAFRPANSCKSNVATRRQRRDGVSGANMAVQTWPVQEALRQLPSAQPHRRVTVHADGLTQGPLGNTKPLPKGSEESITTSDSVLRTEGSGDRRPSPRPYAIGPHREGALARSLDIQLRRKRPASAVRRQPVSPCGAWRRPSGVPQLAAIAARQGGGAEPRAARRLRNR